MSVITVQDVRNFLWDRTGKDNQLTNTLTFTDDEIREAFVRAAREYNGLPPITRTVNPYELPGNTNMFLDATAMHLYISRMSQMQRNQIEYNAGGSTVNLEKQQIDYMAKMIPLHSKRFEDVARTHKTSCNLMGFFGTYDPVHLSHGDFGGHGY